MTDRAGNSYLNQSWPIAGHGYALITIVTPAPLPAEAVVALEPVMKAVEMWRSVLAEIVHPPKEEANA